MLHWYEDISVMSSCEYLFDSVKNKLCEDGSDFQGYSGLVLVGTRCTAQRELKVNLYIYQFPKKKWPNVPNNPILSLNLTKVFLFFFYFDAISAQIWEILEKSAHSKTKFLIL